MSPKSIDVHFLTAFLTDFGSFYLNDSNLSVSSVLREQNFHVLPLKSIFTPWYNLVRHIFYALLGTFMIRDRETL